MAIHWVRIDDRLVHGQVVEAWIPSLGIDRVLVYSDQHAGDATQEALMRMALPESVALALTGTPGLEEALGRERDAAGRTLILVPDPRSALEIATRLPDLKSVNVGGMHHSAGKIMLGKAIFLNDEDRTDLKKIRERGVELDSRAVPGETRDELDL